MTKELFFARLRSMQVDPCRPLTDQFASRLHQCSFILRNCTAVDISLEPSRANLLQTMAEKLGGGLGAAYINVHQQKPHNRFILHAFDRFLSGLFESFGESISTGALP